MAKYEMTLDTVKHELSRTQARMMLRRRCQVVYRERGYRIVLVPRTRFGKLQHDGTDGQIRVWA